jgi:hypothetical protein
VTKRLGTKEAEMKIVGCDLHAKQQAIAMVDTETGEFTEKTLAHEGNKVREFYAALEGPVVVIPAPLLKRMRLLGGQEWVFRSRENTPINPNNALKRYIGPVTKALGIPLGGWHDFRHTLTTGC